MNFFFSVRKITQSEISQKIRLVNVTALQRVIVWVALHVKILISASSLFRGC